MKRSDWEFLFLPAYTLATFVFQVALYRMILSNTILPPFVTIIVLVIAWIAFVWASIKFYNTDFIQKTVLGKK